MPSRQLIVRVVDGNGKPVADAEVCFLTDYLRSKFTTGRTDAEGRWSGPVPADLKHWRIFARKANVGFDYAVPTPRPGSRDQMPPLPDEVKLTLDGARNVRVKTVAQNGKPIAGAKVGAWYIRKLGRESDINLSGLYDRFAKTDDNGILVLDWLPKQFTGAIPILAYHDDYFVLGMSANLMADKPVEELVISLLPMEKLSGRIKHADGRPAAGITVAVEGQGAANNPFRKATQTDAEGRYELKVNSEHAYIAAVQDTRWAAPYRSGIVVRAGKPVDGVDFVLGRATRLHGRITVAKDGRPASEMSLYLEIDKGQIPPEIQRPGDLNYHPVHMYIHARTDAEGRYEFHLGPGEYQLKTQHRVEPVAISIPAANPPEEIVRDLRMPRAETGRLTGVVVDAEGRPVVGAIVNGEYGVTTGRGLPRIKTDEKGRFTVERCLDPLVLHAKTTTEDRAGTARVDAEASEIRIVLGSTAKASGRLLDLQGKPLAGKDLIYGIRIYLRDPGLPPDQIPWTNRFGGKATTDSDGRFTLTGLIAGETYDIRYLQDHQHSVVPKVVKVSSAAALDLGDLLIDPLPPKPYVPPTPVQQAVNAFSAHQPDSPQQRLQKLLDEARREHTRPLLLFGSPKDPACVDLFRLFSEDKEQASKLRWEFEMASLDSSQDAVRQLAEKLGVAAGKDRPPILAVLDAPTLPSPKLGEDRMGVATHELRLDEKHKLDGRALAAFLQKHKHAERDAEQMLAQAQQKAKTENKRVFFITSASWCGPCRLLSRFLAKHKEELERHYVFVKIDISRDHHADAVCKRLQQGKHEGVPWYAILDADGKALITSDAPTDDPRSGSSNIGFPSSPEGIEHFLAMLKQTAPRLGPQQCNALRKELERR